MRRVHVNRHCINCEVAWPSLAHHELEEEHTCPVCGDTLVLLGRPELESHDTPVPPALVELRRAA
jgi:rRNA maturation endonuclease Nob1